MSVLVIAGTWLTTNVKVWVTAPAVFFALSVKVYFLAVPLAAVPEIVAVPSALSAKVRPLGKVPIGVRAGVGKPEVVTVKVPDVPVVKVADDALVTLGAEMTLTTAKIVPSSPLRSGSSTH